MKTDSTPVAFAAIAAIFIAVCLLIGGSPRHEQRTNDGWEIVTPSPVPVVGQLWKMPNPDGDPFETVTLRITHVRKADDGTLWYKNTHIYQDGTERVDPHSYRAEWLSICSLISSP